MESDSIIYKGQLFKTGDRVTCIIFGISINDAKIYIGSKKELEKISKNSIFFRGLGYIYHNNQSLKNKNDFADIPTCFGYSIAHCFGFRTTISEDLSDNVSNLTKIVRNDIEFIVQTAINNDKQAIENGVLNYE